MIPYDPALFQGTAWYYARYRPPYPAGVFALLIRTFALDGGGWLLDLGAGTGEVAVPLAAHFEQVYSTSFASRRLFGTRVNQFEDELRQTLLALDAAGRFPEERTLEVILALKSNAR